MTEDAPNATDHDDDSKRIASSSYSHDLPNQEPNQDSDVSFVPPDILTIADIFENLFKEWDDEIDPSNQDDDDNSITRIFNNWEEDEIEDEDDDDLYAELFKEKEDEIEDEDDDVDKPFTELLKRWENEREAEEAKVRQVRERVRREYRVEIKKRRKAIPSVTYNLLSDRTPKVPSVSYKVSLHRTANSIETPSSLECIMNSDTNFDRDNPSLSAPLSNVIPPSSELESVSYKVLLHRNASSIKTPPSSLERVINSDANFDRDNPSLLPLILPASSNAPPLSNKNNNNIKSPLSSLERVANYDANFDRDNPSLSTLSSERVTNSDSNLECDNPSLWTSLLNELLSDRTPKAIKSKNSSKVQPATASKAPPLSNYNHNNNSNVSKASLSSSECSPSPELPSLQSIKPPSRVLLSC
jgi:hypothetical protein